MKKQFSLIKMCLNSEYAEYMVRGESIKFHIGQNFISNLNGDGGWKCVYEVRW